MRIKDYFVMPEIMALKAYRRVFILIALLCLLSTPLYLTSLQFPATTSTMVYFLLVPVVIGSLYFGLLGAIVSSAAVFAVFYWFAIEQDVSAAYWLRYVVYAAIGVVIGLFIQLHAHYQRQLTYLINHDPGTGLPSRLALWDAIDQQLSEKNMAKNPNGLAVIAIDNLHDVSITFNHDVADELLVTLWNRIVDVFYPGARAYHYHRERLAVLFHNPERSPDRLQHKLAACLEESVIYNDIPIHFTVRVGYVEINASSRGKRTLINEAESALVWAHERDKQLVIFNSDMRCEKRGALAVLGSVHNAMQSGELTLYYQPKVNLLDNSVIGFEALARWQDQILGVLSPYEFIPLIEKTEIIHPFTHWAIDLALKTLSEWIKNGYDYHVAVNISSHNLSDEDFPGAVKNLLKKHQLPSSVLELEITETEIMKQPELAVNALKELADIPLVISIDDFGTGYSSLAYLHRLPATKLKIDRAFISQIDTDENVKTIVASAINLGHALGMKVIAEGIETHNQRNILKNLGCDIGQGYLFSAAMPASEVSGWSCPS